jgi:cobalt/nickel transport system permease protein
VHHVTLERWSRGESLLHRRDARAKVIALVVFLAALSTASERLWLFAAILAFGLAMSRLPAAAVLRRAAIVLPFCAAFATITAWSGDLERAGLLVAKAYLSAWAVLLVVGTTPMPQLLHGFERLGAPRFLLMVAQFIYRYLFVIVEQAQHVRLAAACRRGTGARGSMFHAAAGAVAALFARSYERAERIHRSMLARGFDGHFPVLRTTRFAAMDAAFAAIAAAAPAAVRWL